MELDRKFAIKFYMVSIFRITTIIQLLKFLLFVGDKSEDIVASFYYGNAIIRFRHEF